MEGRERERDKKQVCACVCARSFSVCVFSCWVRVCARCLRVRRERAQQRPDCANFARNFAKFPRTGSAQDACSVKVHGSGGGGGGGGGGACTDQDTKIPKSLRFGSQLNPSFLAHTMSQLERGGKKSCESRVHVHIGAEKIG